MPNSPSASKRLRQNKVRQERNKATKSAMRTQVKKVVAAAEAGDVEKAEAEFKLAAKKLDRAGVKGIIHANTAGRYKSRLSKMIKKVKDAAAAG
jgi:small subunit ribosomal protein S20